MGSFTIMQFLFQVNRVKNALNTTCDVTLCTLISIKGPFNPFAIGSPEFKGRSLRVKAPLTGSQNRWWTIILSSILVIRAGTQKVTESCVSLCTIALLHTLYYLWGTGILKLSIYSPRLHSETPSPVCSSLNARGQISESHTKVR
jgi:hypothetical protein